MFMTTVHYAPTTPPRHSQNHHKEGWLQMHSPAPECQALGRLWLLDQSPHPPPDLEEELAQEWVSYCP